jgi:hypothetical protein
VPRTKGTSTTALRRLFDVPELDADTLAYYARADAGQLD